MATRNATKEQEKQELEKYFNRFAEGVKITSDHLKHIVTLDTGSIIILGTFSQNFTFSSVQSDRSVLLLTISCLVYLYFLL